MTSQLTFHKRYPIELPWSCDQRGDCCRKYETVVMTDNEYETILAAVTPEKAATLRWREASTPGFMELRAKPCPLLAIDGKCSVYDVRPFNCRRFICGRVGDEPWESNADGSCRNLTVRLAQSRPFRRFYQLLQRRAGRWALLHGWRQ